MNSQHTTQRSFATQLSIIFLGRTAINTSFRIIYPFLPSIARGLRISLTAASGLITLRVVAGMSAPFLGPIADHYGRRRTMEAALLLFTLASLLLAGLGTFIAAALAFSLYGLAKILYDPSMQAYIGDSVPYDKRARAMGLIELSWSGAWLLGVPAAGLLIERLGWRAPWAVLILLGALGVLLTHIYLPNQQTSQHSNTLSATSITAMWFTLLRRKRVVVFVLISLFITLAIEIPFIVYGAWLETNFKLSLGTLGLASTVVGLAEASAEFGTVALTDRLGKRRSILAGILGLAASLFVLPWLAQLGLAAALIGVALAMLTFEFALVSSLPLATEIAPDARASLLSLNVTAYSLARILGALIGGWLWQWQNITLHAVVGALCALAAAVTLIRGLTSNDMGSASNFE